jgi:hypothetical protein
MRRPLRNLALAAGTLCLALLVLPLVAGAQAVGPPGGGIYAHDELFKVVATPRDLPPQGKFDTIYALGGDLMNVSDAAPGDPAYNGGRWEVRPITWTGMDPTQFTNAEQIKQAAAMGKITIGDVVRRFECPLIPDRGRR